MNIDQQTLNLQKTITAFSEAATSILKSGQSLDTFISQMKLVVYQLENMDINSLSVQQLMQTWSSNEDIKLIQHIQLGNQYFCASDYFHFVLFNKYKTFTLNCPSKIIKILLFKDLFVGLKVLIQKYVHSSDVFPHFSVQIFNKIRQISSIKQKQQKYQVEGLIPFLHSIYSSSNDQIQNQIILILQQFSEELESQNAKNLVCNEIFLIRTQNNLQYNIIFSNKCLNLNKAIQKDWLPHIYDIVVDQYIMTKQYNNKFVAKLCQEKYNIYGFLPLCKLIMIFYYQQEFPGPLTNQIQFNETHNDLLTYFISSIANMSLNQQIFKLQSLYEKNLLFSLNSDIFDSQLFNELQMLILSTFENCMYIEQFKLFSIIVSKNPLFFKHVIDGDFVDEGKSLILLGFMFNDNSFDISNYSTLLLIAYRQNPQIVTKLLLDNSNAANTANFMLQVPNFISSAVNQQDIYNFLNKQTNNPNIEQIYYNSLFSSLQKESVISILLVLKNFKVFLINNQISVIENKFYQILFETMFLEYQSIKFTKQIRDITIQILQIISPKLNIDQKSLQFNQICLKIYQHECNYSQQIIHNFSQIISHDIQKSKIQAKNSLIFLVVLHSGNMIQDMVSMIKLSQILFNEIQIAQLKSNLEQFYGQRHIIQEFYIKKQKFVNFFIDFTKNFNQQEFDNKKKQMFQQHGENSVLHQIITVKARTLITNLDSNIFDERFILMLHYCQQSQDDVYLQLCSKFLTFQLLFLLNIQQTNQIENMQIIVSILLQRSLMILADNPQLLHNSNLVFERVKPIANVLTIPSIHKHVDIENLSKNTIQTLIQDAFRYTNQELFDLNVEIISSKQYKELILQYNKYETLKMNSYSSKFVLNNHIYITAILSMYNIIDILKPMETHQIRDFMVNNYIICQNQDDFLYQLKKLEEIHQNSFDLQLQFSLIKTCLKIMDFASDDDQQNIYYQIMTIFQNCNILKTQIQLFIFLYNMRSDEKMKDIIDYVSNFKAELLNLGQATNDTIQFNLGTLFHHSNSQQLQIDTQSLYDFLNVQTNPEIFEIKQIILNKMNKYDIKTKIRISFQKDFPNLTIEDCEQYLQTSILIFFQLLFSFSNQNQTISLQSIFNNITSHHIKKHLENFVGQQKIDPLQLFSKLSYFGIGFIYCLQFVTMDSDIQKILFILSYSFVKSYLDFDNKTLTTQFFIATWINILSKETDKESVKNIIDRFCEACVYILPNQMIDLIKYIVDLYDQIKSHQNSSTNPDVQEIIKTKPHILENFLITLCDNPQQQLLIIKTICFLLDFKWNPIQTLSYSINATVGQYNIRGLIYQVIQFFCINMSKVQYLDVYYCLNECVIYMLTQNSQKQIIESTSVKKQQKTTIQAIEDTYDYEELLKQISNLQSLPEDYLYNICKSLLDYICQNNPVSLLIDQNIGYDQDNFEIPYVLDSMQIQQVLTQNTQILKYAKMLLTNDMIKDQYKSIFKVLIQLIYQSNQIDLFYREDPFMKYQNELFDLITYVYSVPTQDVEHHQKLFNILQNEQTIIFASWLWHNVLVFKQNTIINTELMINNKAFKIQVMKLEGKPSLGQIPRLKESYKKALTQFSESFHIKFKQQLAINENSDVLQNFIKNFIDNKRIFKEVPKTFVSILAEPQHLSNCQFKAFLAVELVNLFLAKLTNPKIFVITHIQQILMMIEFYNQQQEDEAINDFLMDVIALNQGIEIKQTNLSNLNNFIKYFEGTREFYQTIAEIVRYEEHADSAMFILEQKLEYDLDIEWFAHISFKNEILQNMLNEIMKKYQLLHENVVPIKYKKEELQFDNFIWE